jgi:DnaJ-like protein
LRAELRTLVFGFGVSAVLAAAAGPALADGVVMPFSCKVAGGRVMLAPTAPQRYEILGRAEHQQLNTCSPYDPRKCHSWSVHRFTLDCGGAPTSWQSVVAALAPILAESVGTAAAEQGYDAYGPPPGRAGAFRPGRGGGVSFPRGFAPNPMNVARFERSAPVVADIPVPPKKPEETAPAAPEAQVAAAETKPKTAASKPGVPDLNPPDPADMPAIPAMDGDTAADTSQKSEEASEVAGFRSLKVELDAEVTGALPEKTESAMLWQSASTVFMWTLAVLFALTATLLFGRQRILERLPMPPAILRLRGPANLPAIRTPDQEPEAERYSEAVRRKEATASRLRLWDEDWLPRTVLEALDVLGVAPDASKDKIKSTVTRLRRALHPDHAIDDEDRALRERRLKQINVAWEIIGGKRRVPWLKQSR